MENFGPEKRRFLERIDKQIKEEGLLQIHFSLAKIPDCSEEELYAELNRTEAAIPVPDPEVLGKYSI